MARLPFSCCLLMVQSAALGQAAFTGIGDLPGSVFQSFAFGVSADGTLVAGSSESGTGHQGLVWTEAAGMQVLSGLSGPQSAVQPRGISGDGVTVVGAGGTYYKGFPVLEAFRWTSAASTVGLGFLVNGPSATFGGSEAFGASWDGTAVIGRCGMTQGYEAFRWTLSTGMVGLGFLTPTEFYSAANGVSADGAVVVGAARMGGPLVAFRWSTQTGMVSLPLLPGLSTSAALDVSYSGEVAVGYVGSTACLWDSGAAPKLLSTLFGDTGSEANAVSGDGSTVVGRSSGQTGHRAFVWSVQRGGMWSVPSLLSCSGINLSGWKLESATDVSADGAVIVGNGINPSGHKEGWIARLPAPCYADCNRDCALTVSDFGCFQSRFVANDPYADCNNSGSTTVADFGCFQTKFVAGCP